MPLQPETYQNNLLKFAEDDLGDVAVRVVGAVKSGWDNSAQGDNAVASIVKAAVLDKRHRLESIHASFSAALAGKTVTVKDGAAVLAVFHIHNQRDVVLQRPIVGSINTDLTIELAASGTLGTVGALTAAGDTV